jgi:hypothetical protein
MAAFHRTSGRRVSVNSRAERSTEICSTPKNEDKLFVRERERNSTFILRDLHLSQAWPALRVFLRGPSSEQGGSVGSGFIDDIPRKGLSLFN